MAEEILFETEQNADRTDVAEYLRTVADRLEAGDAVSLSAPEQSVTISPPQTVEFEVKVEREGGDGSGEIGFELELEWEEGARDGGGTDGVLSIE